MQGELWMRNNTHNPVLPLIFRPPLSRTWRRPVQAVLMHMPGR